MSQSHPSATQSVESFNLCLESFESVLQAEKPILHVEERLMTQLPGAVRLLRWAIVKVESQQHSGQRYWCEGAYLKALI